jgi:ABC-type transport system involved in cytochrome c biogenesis permease component
LAQALGDGIATISPDYAAYGALFVSAGFDGMLLCDADDGELQQLVLDVGIVNAIYRRRVVAQLRAVRSQYALQSADTANP